MAVRQPTDGRSVRGMRRVQLVAGYGAIACALPYLALKIVWLSRGTLGVADLGLIQSPSFIVLNIVTACMDLVGIGLALAFTQPWGLRVPAWLLLPPIWVASGLLIRFIIAVPLTAIVAMLRAESPVRGAAGPVLPWVYVLVYIGFAGQGVGLAVGFVLYVWRRWGEIAFSSIAAAPPGPTHGVQRPLAIAAAVLATLSFLMRMASVATGRAVLLNAVDAGITAAGVLGVVILVCRLGRQTRIWWPLTLTWTGSAFLFGWGLWQTANALGRTALLPAAATGSALINLDALLRLVSGLVIGLVMLFFLAERHAPSGATGSASSPSGLIADNEEVQARDEHARY